MLKITFSILLLSMLSAAATASAAGQMKAGLWEMQVKSDAMKNMPKIPPEQMEQMRRMGVNIPRMQDGAIVTKVCISKEMAERDQIPRMVQKDTGCQTRNFKKNGSSYSMEIVCDSANMRGQGMVKGSFESSERFSSTYDFKGSVQGQPTSQHSENSGIWLSLSCGEVKPLSEFLPGR